MGILRSVRATEDPWTHRLLGSSPSSDVPHSCCSFKTQRPILAWCLKAAQNKSLEQAAVSRVEKKSKGLIAGERARCGEDSQCTPRTLMMPASSLMVGLAHLAPDLRGETLFMSGRHGVPTSKPSGSTTEQVPTSEVIGTTLAEMPTAEAISRTHEVSTAELSETTVTPVMTTELLEPTDGEVPTLELQSPVASPFMPTEEGIESAVILQATLSSKGDAFEPTVLPRQAAQGSLYGHLIIRCQPPCQHLCQPVLPSPACQLVLYQVLKGGSGTYCLNVSLADANSLAKVRKQVLGKLPSVVILLMLIVMVLASLVHR
ncbi:Melanocyte protein PMEL [Manis javanica]|nr:Melanocyte protein PMEL [Manis javanica]